MTREETASAAETSAKTHGGAGKVVAAEGRYADDSTLAEAVRRMQAARLWISENPDAWHEIQRMAQADLECGIPVSIRGYFETLRHKDWVARDGKPTKFNNDLAAPLARLLVAENSALSPLVERRRSILDVLEKGETRSS